MKKTLLATSIVLTLGFSAHTYAQPSFDDINFADDGSTSMEDGNLVGNSLDLDAALHANTNDSNHTNTTNTADVDANVDVDASTNDSNNSVTKTSADTVTKTNLDLDADVDVDASTNDSNNTVTKTNTLTKTSADTVTKTKVDLNADVDLDNSTNDSNNTTTTTTNTADNGSVAMNDGNTVTASNTELTIGDLNIDTAVNRTELTASVTGNTITMSAGGLEAVPGSIDASNSISGGSMNFTGVGLATQNSGAAASTQASISVQSNLAF